MPTEYLDLGQFPPDILNVILSMPNMSDSVIRLWKCGNNHLNYLISNGGCQVMKLVDKKWNSTSRFPKMLLSLRRLRKLKINRGKYILIGAYELKALLLQLSTSIETLKLTCREAETCFFRNPDPDSTYGCFAPSSDTIALLSTIEPIHVSSKSPLWDIGSKFPNLRSLSIDGHPESLLNRYTKYLPSNLTYLSNYTEDSSKNIEGPVKMPKNLVSLRLNLPSVLSDFSGLPHTLRNFYTTNRKVIDDSMVGELPKGLEYIGHSFNWTPSVASSIPPLISSITLENVDFDAFHELNTHWISVLPKSLTELHVDTSAVFDGPGLKLLPATLKKMFISGIEWSSITDSTFFPPILKQFRFACKTTTPQDIGKLPRGLTNLSMILNPELSKHCWPYLPPSLEKFEYVFNFSSLQLEEKIDFPTLPRNLRYLDVDRKYTFSSPFEENAQNVVEPIPRSMKDRFPPHLKHLGINWYGPRFNELPETLESFSSMIHPKYFSHLPRRLTSLDVTPAIPLTKEHLRGLPPMLQTLTILRAPKPIEWELDLFSALPASLLTLYFSMHHDRIPYQLLLHLPPRVQCISASIDVIENEIFERLPRSVRSLAISSWGTDNSSIEAIPHMPPHLKFTRFYRDLYTLEKEALRIQEEKINTQPCSRFK